MRLPQDKLSQQMATNTCICVKVANSSEKLATLAQVPTASARHPDGRWTIVSVHGGKTIPGGTLRKIIRDTGLTVEEFSELL